MGVDGFLRSLRDVVDQTHLQQFKGQTLVVDALSWLHKACYGCAFELSTGKETDTYVQYMLHKVDMMRSCGVAKVILVFDGQRLPLKSSTQAKRQNYKEENRKRALQAMAAAKRMQGNDRQDEFNRAYQLFQRSVSITSEIISTVMDALRAAKVPFVVAPFEADAQMVWMCKEGLASGIVTEDSDVVVYCVTANVSSPVLVKLDDTGSVQAVSRSIIHRNSEKASSNALLRKIHFLTSGDKEATRMFVQVCVLAGCDFIDSLPNVGFPTAVKHIFNFRGAPAHLRVQRLVSKLSSSGTKTPSDFLQQFVKAETIFFHHIVFDPKKRSCEFLINDRHSNCFLDILQRAKESLGIASAEDELDLLSTAEQDDLHKAATSTKSFLGQVLSRVVVEQIYKGEVCPRTLRSKLKTPSSSQALQRQNGFQSGQKTFDAPSSLGDLPSTDSALGDHMDEVKPGFRSTVTRREVNKPSPAMRAEQIENKKRLQTHEREISLQSLLSTYKPSASTAAAVVEMQTATAQTKGWSGKISSGSEASTHILATTAVVAKTSKVTSTSLKDLVARHSQSVHASTSPKVVDSRPKPSVVPRSAPESKKRPRPATKPAASSARKAPKTALGKKTLFDFFQKQ